MILRSLSCLTGAILLVLSSWLTGCWSEPDHLSDFPVISDSSGIRVVQNGPLSDESCGVSEVPAVSIGVVEGEDVYQLHRVTGAGRLSNGHIVVLNQGSHELRLFDQDGQFIASGGVRGEGPGEFENPLGLRITAGDSIWVSDFGPVEFEVFDSQVQWTRGVRIKPEQSRTLDGWGVLDDRTILAGNQETYSTATLWQLLPRHITHYAETGLLRDTLASYPDSHWGLLGSETEFWASPLFESFADMDARGSTMMVGRGNRPQFDVWKGGGSPRKSMVVKWFTGALSISSDDIERRKAEILSMNDNVPLEMKRLWIEPQVADDRPVAASRPVFSSLEVGADGSLWSQVASMFRSDSTQQWLRFKSDGTFVCTLTLPISITVYDMGSDYVVGRDRSEAGIERVVQFALLNP